MDYTHTGSLADIIHYSRTLCSWDPFSDIWQCLWHPEPFHAFMIGCSAKTFNGWLPLNVFAEWLCPTCVTGTWVSYWIDVILIWYHYIAICTLVTIFNWWLSGKDMKLRVLIKEVLVVFHFTSFISTHVSHYTAMFTCERASSTVFVTRDNSRIIIKYNIYHII